MRLLARNGSAKAIRRRVSHQRILLGIGFISFALLCNSIPAGASGPTPPTTTTTTTSPSAPPTVIGGGGGGQVYWGWDQLVPITSTDLTSYEGTYGDPVFMGRYLYYGKNTGDNLTNSEVSLLESHDIGILLIYDPKTDMTSASQGTSDASAAVSLAEDLGATSDVGTAIYRDVEASQQISGAYINAWYTEMETLGFVPGFYENSYSTDVEGSPSSEGEFDWAYCSADSTVTSATRAGTLLYSDELEPDSSDPVNPTDYELANAPGTFNPQYTSPCEPFANVSDWQYLQALSSGSPIDVDEGVTSVLLY